MLHPYLENTTKIVQYVLIWIVYAALQIIAMYSLMTIPLWIIILDGFIHATLFGILGILLWSVIHYGNFSILNKFQQLINYIALGVLTIIVWIGVGYGVIYWLFDVLYTNAFIHVLSIRVLIGILIYLLIIQQFRFTLELNKCEAESEETTIQEEVKQKKDEAIEILERIAVKSGTKIHVVLIPEIIYLQADGDYVQIITVNGKYLKEQTMKYFEEHLPENQFVRVHRSAIVNVEMISRIELYEKQNQLLTLKNGHQLKTSTAGYKALRGVLNL